MNKRQISRRHFTLCAAVGLSLPIVPAASVVAVDAPPRTVKLRNTAIVPAIGQGSARLGQGRHPETAEQEALRTGISFGMSLIDTSGNYGNGRSEKLIGRAIAGQRDSVFLVSKVEADEVSGDRMTRASLARIGAAHGCSAAAVALAWAVRRGNVIAIPEAGSPAHVKENAVALSLTLTTQELQTLDTAFPESSGPD